MTAQPTRDQLRALASRAADDGYTGNDNDGHLTVSPAVLTALLDQLDQAEHRIARLEAQTDIRGRAVAIYQARARDAEARVGRLENRAASETARANEWRRKHRVMAEKRNAAHRAWASENEARREAEARIKAVENVLEDLEQQSPDQIGWDAASLLPVFRRALDGGA